MTELEKVEIDMSPDESKAWVHFSHLSLDDFGRSGTLSHWKISRLFQTAHVLACNAGAAGYKSLDRERNSIVFLGSVSEYDPALWAFQAGTQFPFTVTFELESMGTSSQTVTGSLINKLDNKTLATLCLKGVHVSLTNRRPVPFPDHLREKYRTLAGQSVPPLVFSQTVPQVPESAFQFCTVVRASDLDFNEHTNNSSYVKFCCDAAQAAVKAGHLDSFRPDICLFPLQKMEVVYLDESGAGDTLHVSLWQQDGRPSLVNYVISREKSNQRSAIFYASMTYGVTPVKAYRL